MNTKSRRLKGEVILLALVCFLAVGLLGCDQLANLLKSKKTAKETSVVPVAVKGTIIARVNNFPITLEDLNSEIEEFNKMISQNSLEIQDKVGRDEMLANKINTREQKIDYLKNEVVRRTLLYQEALDEGLDRKEEVVDALEKTKEELLLVELMRQRKEKIEVTPKEIEDYYSANKDQLKEPEERQIREIVVSTEQEAKDILIQLLQGTDFATLARQLSKSASAKDGGDLGFIKKDKKFAQFDAIAFSDTLDVGKISSIFKGPEGYYILKLEGKRGGKAKALSELWEDIKNGLTILKQQKMLNDLIAKLSKDAKIEIYEGEIK